jgi:hypothetical protein
MGHRLQVSVTLAMSAFAFDLCERGAARREKRGPRFIEIEPHVLRRIT